MKKMMAIVMVIAALIGMVIPSAVSADEMKSVNVTVDDMKAVKEVTMWVNCENGKTLNVRVEPSMKAKALYRVECGTKLTVSETGDRDWVRAYADGKEAGYVMKKFLVSEKPGKYEITEREDNFRAVESYKVTALPRGKNTEESVGLRTKPNKTSKAIRRLMAGDTLEVIEVGKTWSKVVDPQTGKTGYVANDYIEKA